MDHSKDLTSYNIDRRRACGILCGGDHLDKYIYYYYQKHIKPLLNIVPKVIKNLHEFSPLMQLKMENELPKTGKWKFYQNTMIPSAKHYI
jgi:hypothetical protein